MGYLTAWARGGANSPRLCGGEFYTDDMHVIMYKVLAYLYKCLKLGKDPDKEMPQGYGPLFGGG